MGRATGSDQQVSQKPRRDENTALVIVDVQHDFLPGGALGVPGGDQVIDPILREADKVGLVVATRDAHPHDHSSFASEGGPWPVHCVDGTHGAELHPSIAALPAKRTINKGTNKAVEQYSGFSGTHLGTMLKAEGFNKVIVAGLATDYCVKATVLDALAEGFEVEVLSDGIRGVDVQPGDSERAVEEMRAAGAVVR